MLYEPQIKKHKTFVLGICLHLFRYFFSIFVDHYFALNGDSFSRTANPFMTATTQPMSLACI